MTDHATRLPVMASRRPSSKPFEVGHPLAQRADLLPEGLSLRVDPLA